MSNTNVDIKEKIIEPMSGVIALFIAVCLFFLSFYIGWVFSITIGVLMFITSITLFAGITIINPNESVVTQLFGNYYGTVYQNGILFMNPFLSSSRISLKRQNFSSDKVKVNDKRGNPIELAVIVSWRVGNATKAEYNVGSLKSFIEEQVRGIFADEASKYSYDSNDNTKDDELVFRRNSVDIANILKGILQDRVDDVGIEILELRFNHCAYSSEIAHAMLQKQQAEAMLDARRAIVDGAYSMVEELIKKFENSQNIKLTDEEISKLTINLMTVLVSEKDTTPVIHV